MIFHFFLILLIGVHKKSNSKIKKPVLEDYETFLQNEILPKELRNINSNLIKLIPHSESNNLNHIKAKIMETKREITQQERQMIDIKYNLKMLNNIHNNEVLSFQKLKSTIGVKDSPIKKTKTFAPSANWSKMSNSPFSSKGDFKNKNLQNLNNRYQKWDTFDDQIDEAKMTEFQKALSLPVNQSKKIDNKLQPIVQTQHKKSINWVIDETDEYAHSVNGCSNQKEEELKMMSQKHSKSKHAQESLQNSSSKTIKSKFWVIKVDRIKSPSGFRWISPVNGVLSTIQNSSIKMKLLKLNLSAFKKKTEQTGSNDKILNQNCSIWEITNRTNTKSWEKGNAIQAWRDRFMHLTIIRFL